MNTKGVTWTMLMTLLSMVIFAMVLILGYRMIDTFSEQTQEVRLVSFQRDLQSMIDGISFGTKKTRDFETPSGFREFWLIDRENPAGPGCANAPAVVEVGDDAIFENAYLIGQGDLEAFQLTGIKLSSGCIMAPIRNNKMTLTLSKG